jgi:peptidoglycan-associated lipoprotein
MTRFLAVLMTLVLAAAAACGGNPPPTTVPTPDPFPTAPTGGDPNRPPPPPDRPGNPPPVPREPAITADPLANLTPEQINEQSPLKPVFFVYDSDELDDAARQVLADNARVLQQYATWVVTIEGHCDERGTPEYNLALGDRRALAVKNFLISLGIPADRLRTVSFGKEFPFDPGHDETAWSRNRRAHFMVASN